MVVTMLASLKDVVMVLLKLMSNVTMEILPVTMDVALNVKFNIAVMGIFVLERNVMMEIMLMEMDAVVVA